MRFVRFTHASFPIEKNEDLEIIISEPNSRFNWKRQIDIALKTESCVIVQQDVEFSLAQKRKMLEEIAKTPTVPISAPTVLYPKSTNLPAPVFNGRIITNFINENNYETRWINFSDRFCDLPALDCVYIPTEIFQDFKFKEDSPPYQFDADIGKFFYLKNIKTRLVWEIIPQHYHY